MLRKSKCHYGRFNSYTVFAELSYRASAHIGQNVLLSATPEKPYFIPDKTGEIYGILENIADFARANDNSSLAAEFTKSSLILSLLSACINEKHLLVEENSVTASNMQALDEVINYMLENPSQKTDMKQAAKLANMSYYAFSRQFKEAVGMNFSDYCNVLRIHLAEELLVTTDLSIAKISCRIGIDTQSYFSPPMEPIAIKIP